MERGSYPSEQTLEINDDIPFDTSEFDWSPENQRRTKGSYSMCTKNHFLMYQ